MIEQCFEDLSHALRIFLEHSFRFPDLAEYDSNEAIGNIDIGFNGILNAMHSLYDAHKQHKSTSNWYLKDEFLTIAAIRNARHHNNAYKIRQLFNVFSIDSSFPRILLIRPKSGEKNKILLEYYLRLSDFDELLKQTRKQNCLPDDSRQRIHSYLHWEKIEKLAQKEGVLMENVFYNAIPLIINAGIIIFPDIASYISGKSSESSAYKSLFSETRISQMKNLQYDVFGNS